MKLEFQNVATKGHDWSYDHTPYYFTCTCTTAELSVHFSMEVKVRRLPSADGLLHCQEANDQCMLFARYLAVIMVLSHDDCEHMQ